MAQGCSGHPHRHWLLFPGAPVHTAPASTASAVVSPEVWPVIYRKNNGKYIITLVYDGLWGIKLLGYMMIYNSYDQLYYIAKIPSQGAVHGDKMATKCPSHHTLSFLDQGSGRSGVF